MEDKQVNYFCLRCMKSLTGKQEKFCSEQCRKKFAKKIYKKKYWRKINAKTKTRKIEKKLRRKFLIEHEIKRRKDLN